MLVSNMIQILELADMECKLMINRLGVVIKSGQLACIHG